MTGAMARSFEAPRVAAVSPARRVGAAQPVPSLMHDVVRAPAQPLDAATRNAMETRFHHNFSHVRVHTDARAARSAEAIGAQAYTIGRNIVFAAGRFAPGLAEGAHLLVHELAHVVQNRAHGDAAPSRIAASDSAEERAADAAARGTSAAPLAASTSAGEVHRQVAAPAADPRTRIIALAEAGDATSRQQALDLILSTYYDRPAALASIVYDPDYVAHAQAQNRASGRSENAGISPQNADTGPAPSEAAFGGRQQITIGPAFFVNFRSRYEQRVRTVGHELQHVGQRSPAGGRSVGSTLGSIGLGLAVGAAAGGIGLGIAAAAGATLTGGIIGGVLGGAAALGGLIFGLADPFSSTAEPVRDSHTREFLSEYWVITAQVRGLGPLPPGQILQNINYPGSGILAHWERMPPDDQRRYRAQYQEVLAIKQRLEHPPPAPAAGGH